MNIDSIKPVTMETAERKVPDPGSYDARSDDWEEAEYLAVELADDSLAGLWEGTAGSVFFRSWPYTEFCVMLAGRVALTDKHGARREFGPGDAFVVPKGFTGTWTTLSPARKYFAAMR